MFKVGKINTLTVLERSDYGLYLGEADEASADTPHGSRATDVLADTPPTRVLLPNRYCTDDMVIGSTMDVFVYNDSEDRLVATTERPIAMVGEFAYLQVRDVNRIGAFLDWGLSKDLLVPYAEQRSRMRKDGIYLVYVYLDNATGRIAATAKIGKYLDNVPADYKHGQAVNVLVTERTDIGWRVIVENLHRGMLYANELYDTLQCGQRLTAYVKSVRRSDGRVDLTLTAPGVGGRARSLSDTILERLKQGDMPLTDKSSPDEIAALLHCSKKDFKRAVGMLYREHRVIIDPATGVVRLPADKK